MAQPQTPVRIAQPQPRAPVWMAQPQPQTLVAMDPAQLQAGACSSLRMVAQLPLTLGIFKSGMVTNAS